jgi:lipopolysaccharide export system permease protein
LTAAIMQPDRFYTFSEATVLSAKAIDRDTDSMAGVFMQNRVATGVRVINAQSGRILPADGKFGQRIELESGISQWITATTLGDRQSTFQRLIYFAPDPRSGTISSQRRAMSTADIASSDNPKEIAEFQWRLTLPFIAFFMTLIALELARGAPGSSPYPRIVFGLVVYAALFNLAAVARTWVENGQVQAAPGMLWVPPVAALAYVIVRMIPSLSLRRPG